MAVLVGVVMAAAAAAAGLLASPLISFLYGSAFLPAAPAFQWLLPGIVALSVSTILMNYGGAIGMPRVTWVAPSLGFVANVTFNLWLIPAAGIVGASLSSTIAYGLVAMLAAVALTRIAPAR